RTRRDFLHDLGGRLLLTGHRVSLMRHCASVSLHPQLQLSEFRRFSAAFFNSGVKPVKSTSGSSVASAAFFRKSCPVSSNVSTVASTGSPSSERNSVSYTK